MNSSNTCSNTKIDKVMSPEQFTQIIEAILEGKYSWACVLILRFAGYNPLHYIPYRTYNRLIKDHGQNGRLDKHKTPNLNTSNHNFESEQRSSQKCLRQMTDLAYLEVIAEPSTKVKGGSKLGYLLSGIMSRI